MAGSRQHGSESTDAPGRGGRAPWRARTRRALAAMALGALAAAGPVEADLDEPHDGAEAAPLEAATGHPATLADGIARLERARRDGRPATRAAARFASLLEARDVPEPLRIEAELRLAECELLIGRPSRAFSLLAGVRTRLERRDADGGPPSPAALDLATLRARLALRSLQTRPRLAAARDELRRVLESVPPERRAAAPLCELVRLELAAGGAEEGVRDAFHAVLRLRDAAARPPETSAMTLHDVRAELLEPGGGALLFLLGPDRSHLFALDAEVLEHRELASAHVLAALAERAGSGDADALAALADHLVPRDLRPTVAAWRAAALVGPDPPLGIPFARLPLDGAPLGADRAVRRLPALSAAVERAGRERAGS